jgi:signal transduction histidine kinase
MQPSKPKEPELLSELEALEVNLLRKKGAIVAEAPESLGAYPKLPDTLEAALDVLLRFCDADAGSILLHDPTRDRLESVAARGISAVTEHEDNDTAEVPISYRAFKSRQPVLSDAIVRDGISPDIESTESIVAAPLLTGEECLGVIEIISHPRPAFSSEDLHALLAASEKVAKLIKSEQLFSLSMHRIAQRETLLEVAKAVNTVRDTSELLQFIVATSARLLDGEASSLLLIDHETDRLWFEVAWGEKGAEVLKFQVPLGEGIAGSVAVSGKPVILNDTSDGGRVYKQVDDATGFTTRSIICVPLRIKERIIGVVEVLNCRNEEGFGEEDVSLLEGFASQAAVAIERTRLTEERAQAERLAAVGRTVAGLAHCIKNIMNGLRGGEYLVEKGLRTDARETLLKGWEMTRRAASRIGDLVLDMLTLSRERQPEYEDCNPNDLIEEVVGLLEERARQAGASLQAERADGLGSVSLDRKALFRCLLNLATNALEAVDSGGIVRLTSFRSDCNESFGFEVSDNGTGISEENRKKLFKEFFSTKGSKGTGLGLSVTRKIVQEHGGTIRCESKLGEGTTFTIELPMGAERP